MPRKQCWDLWVPMPRQTDRELERSPWQAGSLATLTYREPAESPISRPDLFTDYPLVLTSGARVMAYTHSQFRNIERLRRLMPEPLADINPADASPRGIRTGDRVKISSPRGTITMQANVTDTILEGAVSIPHHWPDGANANSLVDDRNLDPVSGFLPCKSLLCQVTKG